MAQARRWMLTFNNPTVEDSMSLVKCGESGDVRCMVWGCEHEDLEGGTPHYQVYINFISMIRVNRLKTMFPRAHIEIAQKPNLACCRYCAKEGHYITYGAVPDLKTGHREGSQAQRKAAENLERVEALKEIRCKRLRLMDMTEEQWLDTKLVRAAQSILNFTTGPRRPDVQVRVICSPSGWGKTYAVYDKFEDVTRVEYKNKDHWFINAEEEVCLFDEFAGRRGQIAPETMLTYLDEYPIALPVKGSHRPCYWKLVIICTNIPPDQWYFYEDKNGQMQDSLAPETRNALYRRIGYGQWEGTNPRRSTRILSDYLYTLEQGREEINKILSDAKELMRPVIHEDEQAAEQHEEAAAAVEVDSDFE